MDFSDVCIRTSKHLSCPYSNLTCRCCPFSLDYRNTRMGLQIYAENCNRILDNEFGITSL